MQATTGTVSRRDGRLIERLEHLTPPHPAAQFPFKRAADAGCQFGRDGEANGGVGVAGAGPETGRFRIPVREPGFSPRGLERLAKEYETEAGLSGTRLGYDPSAPPDDNSIEKKVGVDPKVAADQRGHGLGVSMAVYTIQSDLAQKRAAVNQLEVALSE